MLIIKFPALKGLPSSALKLEKDHKLNRINIIFSFEEVKDIVRFTDYFRSVPKKFEISFPKVAKIVPPKKELKNNAKESKKKTN